MKRIILSLMSGALLAGCESKADAPVFDTAAMDALLSGAVEQGKVIGVSALVYDEGKVVYKGAFGLSDRERDKPVTEDTVWRIYSMTKPVTSALIMDLVEEGKISLDDPVAKYIPELAAMKVATLNEDGSVTYVDQARPMTIKDLMLHRAGIAYGIFGNSDVEKAYEAANLFEMDKDLSVAMDKLSKLPLQSQPGTAWSYSFSIDVLGRVAEVVTGQPLDDLFETRFFAPLGMTETGFYVRPDQADRFASNYLANDDGTYTLFEDAQKSDFLIDNALQSGGGGLVSTLGDYSKFAQMILDGGTYNGTRILEQATVTEMLTNQLPKNDPYKVAWMPDGTTGYGFGYGGDVITSATPKQQIETGIYPGQWGWGGAARTNFHVDPQNGAYGIIMLQFFGNDVTGLHDDFQALMLAQTRDKPLAE